MKVLLVIPHLSGGGGERVLANLAGGLSSYDVKILVFEKKTGYPVRCPVISLDAPINRNSIFSRATGIVRRARQFRKVLRREQPDVVMGFMGEANLLTALFANRPILTVHNHLSSYYRLERKASAGMIRSFRKKIETTASEMLIRWLYPRATVIAVGAAIKQDLVRHFGISEAKITTIQNAIDIDDVHTKSSAAASIPWNPGIPTLITTGRLSIEKGQWHLIRAFAEVRKRLRCQLVIIGTGKLEDYLKELALQMGVGKDVYFPGWQANPFPFMARASIFVLTSMTEGFPLVLLEAMCCNLPVISSDCPGDAREILAPGSTTPPKGLSQPEFGDYGILVPSFDMEFRDNTIPATNAEKQLAEAVVSVLENPDLLKNYAAKGLERVRDFGQREFLEKYRQAIERRML